MNRYLLQRIGTLMLAIAAIALVAGGCASAPKQPDNVQNVVCGTKTITWDVTPAAEISDFDCQLGKKGMDPALIVTLALKNVSDKPLRFKVHVFLEDMDKGNGHLVPPKGKPPVVAPGAVEKVNIPFIKTKTMSKKMLVVVKAMSE